MRSYLLPGGGHPHMNRREFIRLLGGTLAAQAIPASAQELRVRTVGVLIGFANDAEAKARVQAFEQGLQREGWSVGQNLRIEYHYAEGDSVRMQALAKELVELKPDCILGHSTPVVTHGAREQEKDDAAGAGAALGVDPGGNELAAFRSCSKPNAVSSRCNSVTARGWQAASY